MRRPTFTVSAYGAILAAMKVARHGSASRDDHKVPMRGVGDRRQPFQGLLPNSIQLLDISTIRGVCFRSTELSPWSHEADYL